MITETREIYKCEYCKKMYQIKRYAEQHEKACKRNPDNIRACHDCVHLYKKDYTLYFDNYSSEHEQESERKVNLLHCNEIDSFLYPVSVELKGNAFELGDELNQPMKKECEHFKKDRHTPSIKEFLGI